MKDWFDNLEQREKRTLIGGGVALAILMVYFLVWDPFINGMVRLEKNIDSQRQSLSWMRDSAQEAKQLKTQNRSLPAGADSGQSILAVIDRTAKAAKLGGSVKRIRPDGKTKAQVWLEDAPFNDLIPWLEQLQKRQGIYLETSVIEKQAKSGLVSARLVFAGAG